ncbi:MAG: hypothetical protein JRG73_19265, partial [Deltaproteobacteria bacterium]|nr:hypothetical protein [Deltaproteobacteria bacterium]
AVSIASVPMALTTEILVQFFAAFNNRPGRFERVFEFYRVRESDGCIAFTNRYYLSGHIGKLLFVQANPLVVIHPRIITSGKKDSRYQECKQMCPP